jgi:large-conductance mechanosensitive channel
VENWFGLKPLDVILGIVAFCIVALAVFYICTVLKNHRAQKRDEQKDN